MSTTPEVADLVSRLEQLEGEVTRLRVANLENERWRRSHDRPDGEANGEAMSRSRFLRMGGAAAAGAVAAGVSGLLYAHPANATEGNPILIGDDNSASNPNGTTNLYDASATQLAHLLFRVDNSSNVSIAVPAARIAAAGLTSGTDTTTEPKVGLWGQTDDANNNGAGIVGRGGSSGADPLAAFSGSAGVIGTAPDGNTGIGGVANGLGGIGVLGKTDAGYGVVGQSATGASLAAYGGGRLLQALRGTAGAPSSGAFTAGEQVRDANGELWLCVVGGAPGTWRRAATVKDGFQGGSVNMLARPIRIFDSRSGVALAPGASIDVQVTGVVVGGVSVPAGAVGLVGNVAVTQTQAPNGYLTLYPQAAPPSPATANINWFGPNQDLNTSVMVALNPTNGKITIHNGIAGGSAPAHVVLDAAAFVI